jgi:hypothetical protein
MSTSWEDRIEAELQQAAAARQAGNEGMARVCARRAAGTAAGEYLRRRSLDLPLLSAYDRLRYLRDELPPGELSPRAREVVDHLLLRITPDHDLPVDADLVAEARWLVNELLKDLAS